ncbi:unnamed protein product, partial [Polarella glacialis]
MKSLQLRYHWFRFAGSGALNRADAERPDLTSWEQQLAVPSASTYYDAHDMPALSSSRIWHATRKHGFYYGFAIPLDLSLLLRTLGKGKRVCFSLRVLRVPRLQRGIRCRQAAWSESRSGRALRLPCSVLVPPSLCSLPVISRASPCAIR